MLVMTVFHCKLRTLGQDLSKLFSTTLCRYRLRQGYMTTGAIANQGMRCPDWSSRR